MISEVLKVKEFLKLGLRDPYPSVVIGRNDDDEVARKLNEDSDFEETTTEFLDETSSSSLVKRSIADDKVIFTRRGVYEIIENRLSLELSQSGAEFQGFDCNLIVFQARNRR